MNDKPGYLKKQLIAAFRETRFMVIMNMIVSVFLTFRLRLLV